MTRLSRCIVRACAAGRFLLHDLRSSVQISGRSTSAPRIFYGVFSARLDSVVSVMQGTQHVCSQFSEVFVFTSCFRKALQLNGRADTHAVSAQSSQKVLEDEASAGERAESPVSSPEKKAWEKEASEESVGSPVSSEENYVLVDEDAETVGDEIKAEARCWHPGRRPPT